MPRLIQPEPIFYTDNMTQSVTSSIPQEAKLKYKIVNNVELNSVEKWLQDLAVIPSDAWIAGKSKYWFVNLVKNIGKEILGIEDKKELDKQDWILETPMDVELDKVDNLTPRYESRIRITHNTQEVEKNDNKGINGMKGLDVDDFYSDITNEDLDVAPNSCEIYR